MEIRGRKVFEDVNPEGLQLNGRKNQKVRIKFDTLQN